MWKVFGNDTVYVEKFAIFSFYVIVDVSRMEKFTKKDIAGLQVKPLNLYEPLILAQTKTFITYGEPINSI